jgi:ATP-dependent Clp protease protease subunit
MLSQLNKQIKADSPVNSFAVVFDAVDSDSAKSVIQWIIESNFSEEKPDILNMMICSPGGSLSSAFAIIDVMASSTIPIRTIGLGEIASAGLMLFLAGSKGERVLTPNTSIMSHQWSGGYIGKEHELFAVAKEYDLTKKRMMNHYKKHTGLSEKQISKWLLPPQDVYLDANEAFKLGICDRIASLK